jgi:hypothetical protein
MLANFYSGMSVSVAPTITCATAMPSGLHIVPGSYVINGVGYDCSLPGLYRFFDPSTGVCQQKICQTTDVDIYISSLSWLHMDGVREDGLDTADAETAAKQHMIAMQCGEISALVQALLCKHPAWAATLFIPADNA